MFIDHQGGCYWSHRQADRLMHAIGACNRAKQAACFRFVLTNNENGPCLFHSNMVANLVTLMILVCSPEASSRVLVSLRIDQLSRVMTIT